MSTSVNDYWTPTSLASAEQRRHLGKEFAKIIQNVQRRTGWVIYYREISNFTYPEYPNADPVAITLDQYSYGRKLNTAVIEEILKELGILDQFGTWVKTSTYTKFMFMGVEFTIYHISDGIINRGDPVIHADSSVESVYFGYNKLVDVFNIILRDSGFHVDINDLNTVYVDEVSGREYKVQPMGEFPTKLLGMGRNALYNATYRHFRTPEEIVHWFMAGKFVTFENFHFNEAKEYEGPADYYNSPLFKKCVECIQRSPMGAFQYATSTNSTILKKRMDLWFEANSLTFNKCKQDRVDDSMNAAVSIKYSDLIVQEITGLPAEEVIPFKTKFEAELSKKEDFEFFVLSSSEDTIRKRIQEVHQQLGS